MLIQTLKDLREGLTVVEADEALRQLVANVRAAQKKGKLTITLTLAPVRSGAGNVLTIAADLKLTVPTPERESTILYAHDDHTLSRRDPRQPALPGLRTVTPITAPAGDAPKVESL
jgi:translation elongation factor P/translation initiation factor 5A